MDRKRNSAQVHVVLVGRTKRSVSFGITWYGMWVILLQALVALSTCSYEFSEVLNAPSAVPVNRNGVSKVNSSLLCSWNTTLSQLHCDLSLSTHKSGSLLTRYLVLISYVLGLKFGSVLGLSLRQAPDTMTLHYLTITPANDTSSSRPVYLYEFGFESTKSCYARDSPSSGGGHHERCRQPRRAAMMRSDPSFCVG